MNKYIEAKTFEQFCDNQKELINILNHNMTKLERNINKMGNMVMKLGNDVNWIKKLLWVIFGVVAVSFISITIKSGLGI
jgi:hypothetical protein